MYKIFVISFISILFLGSCHKTFQRNLEARDDEGTYNNAIKINKLINNEVQATVETPPVKCDSIGDDSADDPAFWYNNSNPAKTVVFGSNKKGGIHSYDLDGKELQFVQCGQINNIDVRQGIVTTSGKTIDIIAGSNRSDNSISFFILDKNGWINPKNEFKMLLGDYVPYGFCLQKTKYNKLYAYVNDKNGIIYQIKVDFDENGISDKDIVRILKVPTQPEGMVVDDEDEMLYIGEEQKGIHYISTLPNSGVETRILKGSSTVNNKLITYDIEGLTLFQKDRRKYLVASIQGNFSYAIFDLKKKKYLTSFKIVDGKYDAVEETDGIDILQKPLNKKFPEGVFCVQDGFNKNGDTDVAQDFKYISLKDIKNLIK